MIPKSLEFITREKAVALRFKMIEYLPVRQQGSQMETDVLYLIRECDYAHEDASPYVDLYCKTLLQGVD